MTLPAKARPSHVARVASLRVRRAIHRPLRRALVRYAQAPPKQPYTGDKPPVTILLVSAWGMGGTIRAALNMAGYLAHEHEVEILSVFRRRPKPFFGRFPDAVTVTALDDQRKRAKLVGPVGLLQRALRKRSSILVHPSDRAYKHSNLWSDIQLVRALRGRSGFLVTTRPGLNLLAAELRPPGLVTIGLEQMHYHHHFKDLRAAMRRRYKRLDCFVVLTERDMGNYGKFLDGKVRMARIPNTVREMPGPQADLDAKVVLSAGRMVLQKGFDLLIPAFAKVADEHPEWTLRICGGGERREELDALVAELGVEDRVQFPGPQDMVHEMPKAAIFALSSRFEGFPLILLEAMSKGMGVVAFDCPTGPGDIVRDHENGLLIPAKDVDAFAAGLSEMMGDDDLRRRCAGAAVETGNQYKMDAVGKQWDALLADLWRDRDQLRRAGSSAGR